MADSETILLREYVPTDADAVLAINSECAPEVGEMSDEKLALLAEESISFRVATKGEEIVGFLIGLDETSERYGSPSYAWFRNRHANMAYVDRIAITGAARGLGLGQRFYEDFENWANANGKPTLAAEVNTEPDNPPSHRFHQRFGFVEVARERPYGPDEEVAMYEKPLLVEPLA